jgi:hypothetical protein
MVAETHEDGWFDRGRGQEAGGGTARRRLAAVGLAAPALVIALVVAQPFVEPSLLVRDPLAAAELAFRRGAGAAGACCAPWMGAVSMLGVMLWTATAAVLGFAALAAWRRPGLEAAARMALHGGLLTIYLALDDALMLHESAERIDPLGELAVIALAGLGLGSYLWAHGRRLAENHGALLLFALGCFAASLAVDRLPGVDGLTLVAEDALKLSGIGAWAAFHVIRALDIVARSAERG